jgi:hypothetical protein
VVLGTGYRVNVAQYSFLSRAILDRLDVADGYPRLDSGLESSLPGLHFIGATAGYSFGPLMRFVAGTPFAAATVAHRIRQAYKTELRQPTGYRKPKGLVTDFANSPTQSVLDQNSER